MAPSLLYRRSLDWKGLVDALLSKECLHPGPWVSWAVRTFSSALDLDPPRAWASGRRSRLQDCDLIRRLAEHCCLIVYELTGPLAGKSRELHWMWRCRAWVWMMFRHVRHGAWACCAVETR